LNDILNDFLAQEDLSNSIIDSHYR
jgi:hypothetical protein